MKRISLPIMFILAVFIAKAQELKYPLTRKVDTVDVYFGTRVADPYRWLEDDNSAETGEWVKAQNELTESYLKQIPAREKLKSRLTELWNYERFGVPFKEGKYYFFYKNNGLQNQSVLYVREGLEGEPKILLDPNTLSADGTVALQDISVSADAKYLAYSISGSGSDWEEIHVLDIASGKELPDVIKWVKFSGIAWQGKGFYYSRYDEPEKGKELSEKNVNHKLYFHFLGKKQVEDKLIYSDAEHPLRNFSAQTTEDERYLLIYASESTDGNALYCRDMKGKSNKMIEISSTFESEYSVVDHINGKLIVVTNYKAPRKKVMLFDTESSGEGQWKELIPEKTEVLQSVVLAGNMLIVEYMKDACSRAYMYTLDGTLKGEIALPGIGTMGGFSGKKDENVAFYSYTSFTFPNTIYKIDLAANKSEVYFAPKINFDPSGFTVEQVFYESKDGTSIPMFIVHKKGLPMNGKNPTLLYGYGGFNISMTPGFSIGRIPFLENGGIYAVANIRGGGEYGEDWHEGGIKMNKQNVFDDFISAAEYLIKKKYTSSEELAISGGSNGGLLVGACITQRPELFKVALPAVGVMDMLRYHKFTIGWAWAGDYGTSEDSKAMFEYLYNYSPLHNLKKGAHYPATLVTTADHDDRVVPAHSFKFIATLQECQKGKEPVLIRIESKAGHGGGKPMTKVIQEAADIWSFVFYNLGIEY